MLQRKSWTYGIFPSFKFQFHSSYTPKIQLTLVQNAAIQENVKTNEAYEGSL